MFWIIELDVNDHLKNKLCVFSVSAVKK